MNMTQNCIYNIHMHKKEYDLVSSTNERICKETFNLQNMHVSFQTSEGIWFS